MRLPILKNLFDNLFYDLSALLCTLFIPLINFSLLLINFLQTEPLFILLLFKLFYSSY